MIVVAMSECDYHAVWDAWSISGCMQQLVQWAPKLVYKSSCVHFISEANKIIGVRHQMWQKLDICKGHAWVYTRYEAELVPGMRQMRMLQDCVHDYINLNVVMKPKR